MKTPSEAIGSFVSTPTSVVNSSLVEPFESLALTSGFENFSCVQIDDLFHSRFFKAFANLPSPFLGLRFHTAAHCFGLFGSEQAALPSGESKSPHSTHFFCPDDSKFGWRTSGKAIDNVVCERKLFNPELFSFKSAFYAGNGFKNFGFEAHTVKSDLLLQGGADVSTATQVGEMLTNAFFKVRCLSDIGDIGFCGFETVDSALHSHNSNTDANSVKGLVN